MDIFCILNGPMATTSILVRGKHEEHGSKSLTVETEVGFMGTQHKKISVASGSQNRQGVNSFLKAPFVYFDFGPVRLTSDFCLQKNV